MRAFTALVFISLLLLSGSTALASSPPPPPTTTGGTGTPTCWPPPCIPVDGGIGLLMAAGAAYGARLLYGSRKRARRDS